MGKDLEMKWIGWMLAFMLIVIILLFIDVHILENKIEELENKIEEKVDG